MSLTRYERETVILFNEEEKAAGVYTYNGALKRKLSKLCEERPEEVTRTQDDECGGVTFEIPKRWIKVNPARILSEAQKEALRKMQEKRGA